MWTWRITVMVPSPQNYKNRRRNKNVKWALAILLFLTMKGLIWHNGCKELLSHVIMISHHNLLCTVHDSLKFLRIFLWTIYCLLHFSVLSLSGKLYNYAEVGRNYCFISSSQKHVNLAISPHFVQSTIEIIHLFHQPIELFLERSKYLHRVSIDLEKPLIRSR